MQLFAFRLPMELAHERDDCSIRVDVVRVGICPGSTFALRRWVLEAVVCHVLLREQRGEQSVVCVCLAGWRIMGWLYC